MNTIPGNMGINTQVSQSVKSKGAEKGAHIDTTDRISISRHGNSGEADGKMLRKLAMQGQAESGVNETGASSTAEIKPADKEIAITIPFEKHLENASVFILEKTAKQYPGFEKNVDGKSRKAVQIRAHLKDFIEFVKKESPGDLAALSDREREKVIGAATGFVADKIGEEYGMQPHMRRNAIFLSPIKSNIGDYLEYLQKENVTISADKDGNIIATKFFTKEAAMEALGGKESPAEAPSGKHAKTSAPEPEEKKTITHEGNQIIIGGIRLNINK